MRPTQDRYFLEGRAFAEKHERRIIKNNDCVEQLCDQNPYPWNHQGHWKWQTGFFFRVSAMLAAQVDGLKITEGWTP